MLHHQATEAFVFGSGAGGKENPITNLLWPYASKNVSTSIFAMNFVTLYFSISVARTIKPRSYSVMGTIKFTLCLYLSYQKTIL